MLQIKNLNVSYGSQQVLYELNLSLERGKTLAIIGESGAGKTTLGLSLLGLIDGTVTGELVFNKTNLLSLSKPELCQIRWNKISMIFQNTDEALNPVYTILTQVMEPIIAHHLKCKEDARQRALQLLQSVGLPQNRFLLYPHQLSGGEKQRALIAMALANDPDLIILDEPTASLDAWTKAGILQLLQELRKSRTLLLLTHDLATVSKLSDRVAVLYAGRLLELGPTRMVLSNPRHPYTRGLLRCYPNMTTTKDLQGIKGRMQFSDRGCSYYSRCTQAIAACQYETPALKKHGNWFLACHRGGIIPLLTVKGLRKSFASLNAVDSISLTLYEGETLALVGETGSGKTTTVKVIMGIYEPTEGEIFLGRRKILQRDKGFYRTVQMIPQNPTEAVNPRFAVLDAIKEPLDIQKLGTPEEREAQVQQRLEEVELPSSSDFLSRYAHQLSVGQLQRVAIARALIFDPKLLIADEPTAALDASTQAKIAKLLLTLQEERGLSILFITHNLALARKISDRMAVMLAGRIVEEGSSSDLVSKPRHPYTQDLLSVAEDLTPDIPELAAAKETSAKGCPYANRCNKATIECFTTKPLLETYDSRKIACLKANSLFH